MNTPTTFTLAAFFAPLVRRVDNVQLITDDGEITVNNARVRVNTDDQKLFFGDDTMLFSIRLESVRYVAICKDSVLITLNDEKYRTIVIAL